LNFGKPTTITIRPRIGLATGMAKQKNYSIIWSLLSDDELDNFEQFGIGMNTNSVSFSKDLIWSEFTVALAYLLGLKRRTYQEGNHIDFAIGDLLNEGERLFGDKKVDEWIHEFQKLQRIRDLVLNQAGGMVIMLQTLEHDIKASLSLSPFEILKLNVSNFLSSDISKRKQTLGQLSKAIKRTNLFSKEFEERLNNLITKRDYFIHHLWIEQLRGNIGPTGLPSEEQMLGVGEYLTDLAKDVAYVNKVLKGLMVDLLNYYNPEKSSDLKAEHSLSSWSKYIPNFQDVIRIQGDDH